MYVSSRELVVTINMIYLSRKVRENEKNITYFLKIIAIVAEYTRELSLKL